MHSPRLKCRDSCALYIPTVHTFGSVFLTHTLLVQKHNMTIVKEIAEQSLRL